MKLQCRNGLETESCWLTFLVIQEFLSRNQMQDKKSAWLDKCTQMVGNSQVNPFGNKCIGVLHPSGSECFQKSGMTCN